MFVANVDGSVKLHPLIIGKAHKPHAFNGKTSLEHGFYYWHNATAWMTIAIYSEFLLNWDGMLQCEGRKILLLQDNFSGHVVPDALTNIHIENFAPNLTVHVQLNDQGIIHCFKVHYCAMFIHHAIDLYEANVPPSDIYKISQLEALKLAQIA